MSAPLDPSIVSLLRDSALGAIVDRPVAEVLSTLGLPGLPQIPPSLPLPDLPPLPVLDLGALIKPMTDLAGSFGTGIPAVGSGLDPSEVLTQVVSVLQQVTQLGTTAIETAMSLWEGAGATSAAQKATSAAIDTTEVAAQGTKMNADHAAAAASVFTGYTEVTAIIANYLATLAASGVFLATPPGQAFVAASTAQTTAQVLAVIGRTRVELTAHSAEMTADGQKVEVTEVPSGVARSSTMVADTVAAPMSAGASVDTARSLTTSATTAAGGLDPSQYVSQAVQLVQTLMSVGTTGVQVAQDVIESSMPTTADPSAEVALPVAAVATSAPVLGATPSSGGPVASTPAPLQEARAAAALGGGTTVGSAGPIATATTSTPGMVPMAPGPMGAARVAADGGASLRTDLVTAEHGNEVVGAITGIAVPVVGVTENSTVAPDIDPDSPDKALTL